MLFEIQHRSHYSYANPASESYMEVRLAPQTSARQIVHQRSTKVVPACGLQSYRDYFDNIAEQFSIPHRHDELQVVASSRVETVPCPPPPHALDVSVSEARQIYRSRRLGLYEFLNESDAIGFGTEFHREANRIFRPRESVGDSVRRLLGWTYETIRYTPGATRIDTPPAEALARKVGVCQDLAQVMIGILRSAEIPARYVCGYIETEQQRKESEGETTAKLVGFAESHAWIEVGLPGGFWWGLDPTNNCEAGERHVVVSTGRDYLDTTPTRGVFKGSSAQTLSVEVLMRRVAPPQA